MSDLAAEIEALEHRWMRGWMGGEARTLNSLTGRDFIFLSGSSPPAILDRASLVEAATTRWRCTGYALRTPWVRGMGAIAVFASQLDLEARMGDQDWSGRYWLTDLWRKGRVRRGWRLAQRVISRAEDKPDVPAAIRSLQLWKSRS